MDSGSIGISIYHPQPYQHPSADYQGHHHPLSTGSVSGGTSNGPTPSPSPVVRRRAPIACRRCRRMRSKCVHEKARPPCKACEEAGLGAEDCVFPVRGQPDDDRQYRHPRIRASKLANKKDTARIRRSTLDSRLPEPASAPVDEWENMPPLNEIVDAVNRFTHHYFQLGFIHKRKFPDRLLKDYRSVNLFLLSGILSISARLSPALSKRYGTGVKAAEFFMERTAAMAAVELSRDPTLERCQGFYLLSLAQQGNAIRNQSHMNLGISIRMATLMRLHREESYQQMPNPTSDIIIRSESARRTLWMLHSQDSLHSGPHSPISLAASDITALLPCDEADFDAGRQPLSRAALADTPPAIRNPSLVCHPNRSLFASLMQIHHFWGIVSRRAVHYAHSSSPMNQDSEFSQITRKLQDWESSLPKEHRWDRAHLRYHNDANQELAYLGVTMMIRLCHIVARRPYLGDIIKIGQKEPSQRPFLSDLSKQLFSNVRSLFEQIDAQFTDRSRDDGVGAQMTAFCVYCCGLFSAYLCKYPDICPDSAISNAGHPMLSRTRSILSECKEVWPLASRWLDSLEKFFHDPHATAPMAEGSMADGKDMVPTILHRVPAPYPGPHSQDLPSSPFTNSTYSHSHPTISFPHQQQSPQQPQTHQDTFSQAQNSFSIHQGSQLLQTQPHPNQPPQDPVYFSRPDPHAGPLVCMDMLMESFNPPTVAGAAAPPYEMGSTTVMASTTKPYYNSLGGPFADGFESELQNCVGGAVEWVQTRSWMDGC